MNITIKDNWLSVDCRKSDLKQSIKYVSDLLGIETNEPLGEVLQ